MEGGRARRSRTPHSRGTARSLSAWTACSAPAILLRSNTNRAAPEWRNRQTQQTQNLPPARAWGFESLLRHQPAAPRSTMMPDPSSPLHTVRIEKLVFGGDGLARLDGRAVFVPAVAPGELVEIRLTERHPHYARACVERILEPSPDRRPPPCPAFGRCGGCDWLHLADAAQAAARQTILEELLFPLRLPADTLRPLVPAPHPLWYRNKLSFSIGACEGRAVCGFHERNSPPRLISARDCVLQSAVSQQVVRTVERALDEAGGVRRRWPVRLTVREGRRTGERLIVLRWNRAPSGAEGWAKQFADCSTSVVATAPGPLGSRALTGEGCLHERLGPFVFELGPDEFFQTNTDQAERLMQWISVRAAEDAPRSVVELYAGCGAITLFVARTAGSVTAVEADRGAVAAAARNARRNGVDNIRWICGDAAHIARELGRHGSPDLVLADPPRAGLPEGLRQQLAGGWGRRLILVSCHPPALVRDLRALTAAGWRVLEVQPFDMFPQTGHLEVAALLDRLPT